MTGLADTITSATLVAGANQLNQPPPLGGGGRANDNDDLYHRRTDCTASLGPDRGPDAAASSPRLLPIQTVPNEPQQQTLKTTNRTSPPARGGGRASDNGKVPTQGTDSKGTATATYRSRQPPMPGVWAGRSRQPSVRSRRTGIGRWSHHVP